MSKDPTAPAILTREEVEEIRNGTFPRRQKLCDSHIAALDEIAALKVVVADLEAENKSLRDELDAADRATLCDQRNEARREVARLEAENADLRKRIDRPVSAGVAELYRLGNVTWDLILFRALGLRENRNEILSALTSMGEGDAAMAIDQNRPAVRPDARTGAFRHLVLTTLKLIAKEVEAKPAISPQEIRRANRDMAQAVEAQDDD